MTEWLIKDMQNTPPSHAGTLVVSPGDRQRTKRPRLRYGLGCTEYPDCFNCPITNPEDCSWGSLEDVKKLKDLQGFRIEKHPLKEYKG